MPPLPDKPEIKDNEKGGERGHIEKDHQFLR